MLEKAKKGKLSPGYDAGKKFGKMIILPVAVPGCGTPVLRAYVSVPYSCALPRKNSCGHCLGAPVWIHIHTEQ
jgi:hypothetical protein